MKAKSKAAVKAALQRERELLAGIGGGECFSSCHSCRSHSFKKKKCKCKRKCKSKCKVKVTVTVKVRVKKKRKHHCKSHSFC